MSIRIGSNITSLVAQRYLNNSSAGLSRVYERLASGQRINRASDDAAGLAVVSSLNADVRVFGQAIRNGNDAISALSIAGSTIEQFSSIITRVQELAEQSANGTFSRIQRLSLDEEGSQLMSEFNRLLHTTEFNGIKLFDVGSSSFGIQLGKGANGSIFVELAKALKHKKGTGFSDITSMSPGGGLSTASAELYDLNGDGYNDLITHASEAAGTLKVYLNDGNGNFSLSSTITTNALGSNLLVGDFTGDGKVDIAVGRSSSISIYSGNGDATFSSSAITTNTTNNVAANLRMGDLNGDGILDLVGTNATTTISVFLGTGNGQFNFNQSFDNSGTVNAIEILDYDGNGLQDIITGTSTNSVVRTYFGSGQGTFGGGLATTLGGTGNFAFGDLNHDGIVDVALGTSNQVQSFLGRSDGTISTSASFTGTVVGTPYLAISDFNKDGINDIVTSVSTENALWAGNDSGDFTQISSYNISPSGTHFGGRITIGDINGDGVPDLVGRGSTSSTLRVVSLTTTDTTDVARVDLTNQASARDALNFLSNLFKSIALELGNIGASQSRIYAAINTLHGIRENSSAAAGRILDADVARESAEQIRLSILQQAGSAILANANQEPALSLTLLRT